MLAEELGRILCKSCMAIQFNGRIVYSGQARGCAASPTLDGAGGVEVLAGAGVGGRVLDQGGA